MGEKVSLRVPIADAHMHINPVKGLGIEKIGKKFKQFNGWFMAVVCLAPYHYDIRGFSVESFAKSFRLLINECKKLENIGIKYRLILGFHPAIVDRLISEGIKRDQVLKLSKCVIDLACELIHKGEAHGIGEVGVQHYETRPENIEIAFEITKYAIEKACELKVPVHLHIKPDFKVIRDIEKVVEEVNADRRLIVFHHMPLDFIEYLVSKNYSLTIVGKYEILRKAVKYQPRYLVESDYLDDPKRPGAVIVPWAIARSWRRLLESRLCSEDYAYEVNVKNIERVYEVKLIE